MLKQFFSEIIRPMELNFHMKTSLDKLAKLFKNRLLQIFEKLIFFNAVKAKVIILT